MTNGPLTALASGGVYAYGSSNTFPSSTYNASNYWVDVVYSPTAGSHAAVGDECDAEFGGRRVSRCRWRRRRRSPRPVVPSTVSFTVKDSGGNNVAGTVSFNSADTVATFTPDQFAGGGHDLYRDGVGGAEQPPARR